LRRAARSKRPISSASGAYGFICSIFSKFSKIIRSLDHLRHARDPYYSGIAFFSVNPIQPRTMR
jgi:hypothetical protein